MIEYMVMDHLPQKIAEDFVEMYVGVWRERLWWKREFDQETAGNSEKYAVEDGHVLLIAVDNGETVGVLLAT